MTGAAPREPSALLRNIIRDVARTSTSGLALMRSRRDEFPSQVSCDLAGLYMDPVTRSGVRRRLREMWAAAPVTAPEPGREHIVGGGIHAAVYAGTRARMGFDAPFVWEMERVGGSMSAGGGAAVFWLQSRNRPGPPGVPEVGNLNYIPGAVVQPTHITSAEYPDNSVVSWCVEMTLAAYADVRMDTVTEYSPSQMKLTGMETGVVRARRIIDARGMGVDSALLLPDEQKRIHVITFQQFMNRMGGSFPLRGIRRAAVVGGGPSGRAAVESMVGIAPAGHYSVPELDWVRQIDWYAPGLSSDREDWLANDNRSRSLELSRFLPRAEEDDDGNFMPARKSESRRVRVFSATANPVDGPDSASIGARGYDLVVVCAGLARRSSGAIGSTPGTWNLFGPQISGPVVGQVIARRYGPSDVFAVGPVAELPVPGDQAAQALTGEIPGNKDSIFLTAPRTAQLAMMLS